MTRRRGDGVTTIWLLWLMWALVLAYLLGLLMPGQRPQPLVEIGLGNLTQWVPVIVMWVAVWRTRFRRLEIVYITVAVTLSACGDVYYYSYMDSSGVLAAPSPADALYLAMYPLVLLGLIVLVRRSANDLTWAVLLDAAVGALGAAALLAVLVGPVFDSSAVGSASLSTAVSVAYPIADVLLVAAIAGMAAAPELGFGSSWAALALGLVVVAATDVVYALLSLRGDYSSGQPLDVGWAVGTALIAIWADAAARSGVNPPAHRGRVLPVPVPAIAVCIGLGVLVLGTQTTLSTSAIVLAGATISAAVVPLIFRQRITRRESRTDELTGLPNRRAYYADAPALLSGVRKGLARTRVPSLVRTSALFLLDLDRFKDVNDSLGHQVGDQLLVMVAERLSASLGPRDLLARLGGDEFAIVLPETDEASAVRMALRIRAALATPFLLQGIGLKTSVSIGIALTPRDGQELSVLLRKADIAMYNAKASRGGHHVYGNEDDGHGGARLRTVEELRRALTDDQFVLHFQPKLHVATDEISGVEALVRWQHPARGLLYPDSFLPLVEDAGLMPEMTWVVLGKALDQASVWHARGLPLTIAVNLSASSLGDVELPTRIAAMVADRSLPASALMLEITESFLLTDRARALDILNRLRDAGTQISIDDFGTGYSSLAYLRELPIDELKLDRSFILPMAANPRAGVLVSSTIDLAHKMGLRIVAEGVEDGGTLTELTDYGCDSVQGYFLSRPVPADEIDAWLAARHGLAVPD